MVFSCVIAFLYWSLFTTKKYDINTLTWFLSVHVMKWWRFATRAKKLSQRAVSMVGELQRKLIAWREFQLTTWLWLMNFSKWPWWSRENLDTVVISQILHLSLVAEQYYLNSQRWDFTWLRISTSSLAGGYRNHHVSVHSEFISRR